MGASGNDWRHFFFIFLRGGTLLASSEQTDITPEKLCSKVTTVPRSRDSIWKNEGPCISEEAWSSSRGEPGGVNRRQQSHPVVWRGGLRCSWGPLRAPQFTLKNFKLLGAKQKGNEENSISAVSVDLHYFRLIPFSFIPCDYLKGFHFNQDYLLHSRSLSCIK